MTKQDYLIKHPGAELTMAPITGDADICLSDYMDRMCNILGTFCCNDVVVFSYEGTVVRVKYDGDELSVKDIKSGMCKHQFRDIVSYLMKDDVELSDVRDNFEDFSHDFFIMDSGNIFMPDYWEGRTKETLHNDGYIRCIYVNDESAMGADLKKIQNYLEESNEDPDCQTVCTTQQTDEHDIKFEWWYKNNE